MAVLKAKVLNKGIEHHVNEKFVKREVIVETLDSKYPKSVCLTLMGNRVDIIDPYQVNEVAEFHYSPESREYQGKWYTTLVCWKIEKHGYNENSSDAPYSDAQNIADNKNWEGDLPF